jgi:hypothetical protein
MRLIENWKEFLKEVADPETIDTSSFEVKSVLHPDFWEDEERLNEEIGDRLYSIAKEFFKSLDLNWVDLLDVTFTGSLANYTWSSYSDIDLHVIVDYNQVDENQELVVDFLRKSGALWNRSHKILIKGFEVEVYIQDANEPHYSTGIYSVKKDEWIEKPSQIEPEIDVMNIQKKAATLMDDVDEVYELFTNEEYEPAYKLAEKIKDKIRKFRQAGLESGGAYSVENLAFKVLRRNEYLRKLSSLKVMSYDKMMSINGEHP